MAQYLAICDRKDVNALVSAECEALTGSKPAQDGIAVCQKIDAIYRSAYVHRGLQIIAKADSIQKLVEEIGSLDFPADDFRIEMLQLSDRERISERQTIIALANAMRAFPNLDSPKHRFMVVVRNDGVYFAEVVIESDHSYKQHADKPYHMSSSLSSRMARALVNLAAPPAKSIVDPCCGTGSILLEAAYLGLEAYGCDINPRMVGMSRKNLAHFGYQAEVLQLNAQAYQQKAEAVVTDLPYGHYQVMEEGNIRAILKQCAYLAPKAVFAVGEDLSDWLKDSGYSQIEVFEIEKFNQFKRFILRGQSEFFS